LLSLLAHTLPLRRAPRLRQTYSISISSYLGRGPEKNLDVKVLSVAVGRWHRRPG
jgi:hypothetical protein